MGLSPPPLAPPWAFYRQPMIAIILVLVLAGAALYCLNLIPMDAAIMTLIRVVVIVAAVFYVVKALGVHF